MGRGESAKYQWQAQGVQLAVWLALCGVGCVSAAVSMWSMKVMLIMITSLVKCYT